VFSLAVLAGSAAGEPAPRWLAVTAEGIGLALAEVAGQIQAARSELRQRAGAPGRLLAREDALVPVLDLAGLLAPVTAPAIPRSAAPPPAPAA
jgi:hypothetical protein